VKEVQVKEQLTKESGHRWGTRKIFQGEREGEDGSTKEEKNRFTWGKGTHVNEKENRNNVAKEKLPHQNLEGKGGGYGKEGEGGQKMIRTEE